MAPSSRCGWEDCEVLLLKLRSSDAIEQSNVMVLFSLGILVDSILTMSFLIKALYFDPSIRLAGVVPKEVV